MRMRTPLTRRFIAALLMVLLTACHSWRPTTVSPQGLIAEDEPSSVRVTLTDGETVIVRNPTMRNDSIVGATDADVGVASQDVRLLEVRHFSVGKTVGLVLGIAAGVVAVAAVALVSSRPETVILEQCEGGSEVGQGRSGGDVSSDMSEGPLNRGRSADLKAYGGSYPDVPVSWGGSGDQANR